MHCRERRKLQRGCDFLETRRIAVFIEETDQVVQNLFLPLRQRHPYPLFRLASQSVGESKAKVNSTKGQVVTHFELWPTGQVFMILALFEHAKAY